MRVRDIEHFIEGFQRFQGKHFDGAGGLYEQLNNGQNPTTLLIGCCDSRVDPAVLLDCELALHGWYFDMSSGGLLAYSARSDAFLPMASPFGHACAP